jgi:hypothetical protein
MLMLALILTGRSKEKTSIGSEGQSAEEGGKCLIGVEAGILEPET